MMNDTSEPARASGSEEAWPPNALAAETSPYLLQHAHNPVRWHPWGEEALELAKREGKPILLSIGYSACHWCHVMAHESFEDPETAAIMNARFVNIKVDREERPDLDRIYQLAHQLLTQRPGGWPLTVFLTPEDQVPFFAGTYFPPEPRYGMPSFRQVLEQIADYAATHPEELARQNRALREAMDRLEATGAAPGAGALPGEELLDAARQRLLASFDRTHGGFGRAPKFPHPSNLERLVRELARRERAGGADPEAAGAWLGSLESMASSGLHDHLRGGFYRYCVDEAWTIPHFEKMLYDNGPLIEQYALAARVTGDERWARVVERALGWLRAEMLAPEGAFYATLDADSEGEEGRFYLWERDEVARILAEEDPEGTLARDFMTVYGLDRPPNFEGRAWHLVERARPDALAARRGRDPAALEQGLERARQRLLAAREHRVRPARDEKILTAWNALAVSGLAAAARLPGVGEQALELAESVLAFLKTGPWREGKLHAVWAGGRARFPAYLDDHAFLLEALLRMLELRWRADDLALARRLADTLLERYQDREGGGFYFTAEDQERLFHRSRSFTDDALPSGNGVAAWALTRLGHLLGEERYIEAARRTLAAARSVMTEFPHAHTTMLKALEEHLEPPQIVVLRGSGEALARWHLRAIGPVAPNRQVLAIPARLPEGDGALPGLLRERAPRGEVVAYVCTGVHCLAPVTEEAELERALRPSELRGLPAAPREAG